MEEQGNMTDAQIEQGLQTWRKMFWVFTIGAILFGTMLLWRHQFSLSELPLLKRNRLTHWIKWQCNGYFYHHPFFRRIRVSTGIDGVDQRVVSKIICHTKS